MKPVDAYNDYLESEESLPGLNMVELGCQGSERQLQTWSLVLLSASIEHVVVGHDILVPVDDCDFARQELDSYEAENVGWPPVGPPPNHHDHSYGPILLGLALLVVYRYSGPWSENVFFAKGALLGKNILVDHEWWRLLTGLTLHADINHVLGNVVFGGVVIGLLGMEIGYGAALFFTVIAGVLGNFVNVGFHGFSYRGIGFSTAVFGAIGVLCGGKVFNRGSLRDFLLPIGAGGGLLAMLGTGGERTDLGAHIWGMIVGGVIGFILARNAKFMEIVLRRSFCQRLFFSLSFAVFALAWYMAFESS